MKTLFGLAIATIVALSIATDDAFARKAGGQGNGDRQQLQVRDCDLDCPRDCPQDCPRDCPQDCNRDCQQNCNPDCDGDRDQDRDRDRDGNCGPESEFEPWLWMWGGGR